VELREVDVTLSGLSRLEFDLLDLDLLLLNWRRQDMDNFDNLEFNDRLDEHGSLNDQFRSVNEDGLLNDHNRLFDNSDGLNEVNGLDDSDGLLDDQGRSRVESDGVLDDDGGGYALGLHERERGDDTGVNDMRSSSHGLVNHRSGGSCGGQVRGSNSCRGGTSSRWSSKCCWSCERSGRM